MFDKSEHTFPIGRDTTFLAHCSISPLYQKAAEALKGFADDMAQGGIRSLPNYFDVLPTFHRNGAALFHTHPDNISYVHNTAEAMCQLANGYPFRPGDQIISYIHEYPSNHYPWVLQKQRGVELILLADCAPLPELEALDGPRGWSMDELRSKITSRTRIIALSHVQFTSGYAADLAELGTLCREQDIDLIVDCAQSLGSLPVYPEQFNIAAVAASGWKWLMGPMGSGILYTSERFRKKITITMAGPSLMHQSLDYLNHQWQPVESGQMFEYSTLAWDHVHALNTLLEDVFLRYSMEDIRAELFRLQDIFLDTLDSTKMTILQFPDHHRSGILSVRPHGDSAAIAKEATSQGVVVTTQAGYLRLAPHFYVQDDQVREAAMVINRLVNNV